MKLLTCACFLTVLAVSWARPDDDHYDSKFDSFNIEEVIANDRLFDNLVNCLLDKGKCSPDGNTFRKIIPEALETSCGKCTEKQKDLIRKFVKALREKTPEQWEELVKKHDETRKYQESFEKFLKGE